MISYDPNTANAYVAYRTERLAVHQENVRSQERKSEKSSFKLWKRLFR